MAANEQAQAGLLLDRAYGKVPEAGQIPPDDVATRQFLAWLKQFSLGRKRILDTLLAATYDAADVHSVLTTNPADFTVFGVFTCITPAGTAPAP